MYWFKNTAGEKQQALRLGLGVVPADISPDVLHQAKTGDWLVTNAQGQQAQIVKNEEFQHRYQPADPIAQEYCARELTAEMTGIAFTGQGDLPAQEQGQQVTEHTTTASRGQETPTGNRSSSR